MKMPRRMKVPFPAFTLTLAAAILCSGCAKQETGDDEIEFCFARRGRAGIRRGRAYR